MRSLFPPARRHTAFVLALLGAAACGPGTDSIPVVDELVVQDPAMVLLDSVPKIMQRADVPGLQLAYLEAGQVIMTAAFGHANSETDWDQGTARGFVIGYPGDGNALVYFTNSENGLAIGDAMLDLVFDDDHWAMRWLDYDRYDDPRRRARLGVSRAFLEQGADAGAAAFESAQAKHPDLMSENRVNALGYVLLGRGQLEEAIWLFERNTLDYPESSNVWDSLGEGLRAAGRLEESIAMYGRAVEMDPTNENARRFITEMEEELAAAASD